MKEIFKRVLVLLILSFIFFMGVAVCINADNIWKTFISLPLSHKDNILSAIVGIIIYIIACKISSAFGRKKHSQEKRQDKES